MKPILMMKLILIAALLGYGPGADPAAAGPKTCTIITASQGDRNLFGYNLDHPNPESYIRFLPASNEGYGGVLIGYHAEVDGKSWIGYEGGMNDQGLAFDTTGLPDTDMNPHPERPYSWGTGRFWTVLLRECSDVEEAISFARNFDFGDLMDFQVHLADSTGGAVIIGPGPDGELAFTRRSKKEHFQVSTNFNPANLDKSWDYPCWRHDKATAMLKEIGSEDDLTVDSFRSILDAVHREGPGYNTICSYVCDLNDIVMHVYYFHQFHEVAELDLRKELAEEEREVRIGDLFSQDTRDRATNELRGYPP